MSPKAQKRMKQEEKHAEFANLLKPANVGFESQSTENFSSATANIDVHMLDECACNEKHQTSSKHQPEPEADFQDCQTYFKKIGDQLFIDGCATKFDLRHFNFLAVKDIQMVFVSTF